MAHKTPQTDIASTTAAGGALPNAVDTLKANLPVGLTLAIVTLPQAIAFSTTLAGLPPHFGIYAAIWGVLFTAILNPSRVFSGGPNTTMSAAIGVILLPVAPPFRVKPFLMMASWSAFTIGPLSPNLGMPGAVLAAGEAAMVAAWAVPAGRTEAATMPAVSAAMAIAMFL